MSALQIIILVAAIAVLIGLWLVLPVVAGFIFLGEESRTRYRLHRFVESVAFARGPVRAPPAPPGQFRRVPLPVPTGLLIVIAGSLGVERVIRLQAPQMEPALPPLVCFAGGHTLFVLLCGAAVLLHLRPGSSRRLKYSLLMVAVSLLWGGRLFGNFISLDALWNRQPALFFGFVMLAGPFYVLGLQLAATQFVRSHDTGLAFPSPQVRRLFARLRKQAVGMIALTLFLLVYPLAFEFFAWWPLMAYLVVRYVLGECLERHPIVYLRSFGQPNAPAAYRIASTAASGYGIVTGLVNGRQPASEISRLAPVSDFGRFYRVPDGVWQQWVSDVLARCSVAIVDVTVGTDSVLWELNQARRIVTDERLVVLKHQQSETLVPAEVPVIQYGSESMDAARLELEHRLSHTANQFEPAQSCPSPGMVRRLQTSPLLCLPSMPCFASAALGSFVFLFAAPHVLGIPGFVREDWVRPAESPGSYLDERSRQELRRIQREFDEQLRRQAREALELERLNRELKR